MSHVVLLGDSIFDNGAYVQPGPDVIAQLRLKLGPGWKATLLAVDGDVTEGVRRQLAQAPSDATHLIISVGGNDALRSSGLLHEPARSMADAMSRLADAKDRFASEYSQMAEAVAARRLPTALCTIYDANYPPPYSRLVVTGLALFNDVITRTAGRLGFDLIDLRLICDEPGDYANPIEPSVQGGAKITAAIAAMVQGRAAERTSRVWT
ncbi:SGNH/GDSL hydrolase family protein [Phenylobacterium deserti]|uniref:SGNH/GDSL hydrolase family protein n=1 Tax=Phenylobacterium deserti TaxID=1914756 RepID=A0A328A9V7_9CAUL|nr:SGNH/GDSL hydrolase family protein [Phenylobacterium deserti]RAK50946.1 SGNH/GDSL hydrolase family protein [Phenylobacterium deserti]